MDVDDGCSAVLEKFVEQTCDKEKWIDCACLVQPTSCFWKHGCIQGIAKVPGAIAKYSIISGHWNGLPDFPETIHGDPGPPGRLHT